MKLFHIIALINLLFLANCSPNSLWLPEIKPVETPSEGFITKMPKPGFSKRWIGQASDGWTGLQYVGFAYRLSKEDRLLHRATVRFVLDELPDMKISTWYSRKEKAMGKVRGVQSFPRSAGYCRYYQVLIQVKKKAGTAVYQACKSMNYNWRYDYGSGPSRNR